LWLPLLGHQNLEFWGIDIDAARIEQAAERFGRERAKVMNAYDLAIHFPAQRFDVVVSTQTLMLFRRLDRILEGIHTVLKPAGRLLFTIGWTRYRPHDQLKRQIRGYLDERYYMRRYDEHEIGQLLQQAGFRLDHVRFGTIDVLKAIHSGLIGEENRNRMLQHWKAMEDVLARDPHFVEQGKKYCLTIYFEAIKEG
jgi:SAM-dependent methyltransferase